MKTDKKTGDHYLRQAKLYFASGELRKSIRFFTFAEKENVHLPEIWLSRGAAFMAIGRYKEAALDFTRVLDHDVYNERAYYFRGLARVADGQFEMGIRDLTSSLSRNNDRGIAHLVRGLAYAELGNKSDALLDINSAEAFSEAELKSFKTLFGSRGNPFRNADKLLAEENAPWNNLLSKGSAEQILNLIRQENK